MLDQFSRTALLVGQEGIEKLEHARVAVFGLGGVGGYTVEVLARSGIGTIDLIDDDKVCLTNLNRQILATRRTIGKYKTEVAKERILDINPKCIVNVHQKFFMPDNSQEFDFENYDYVVDAIDTVTGKIELILKSNEYKVPIISCMGAGNKMNASALEVADIYNTSICPLARVMRRELKKRNVEKLKVVYSKETPLKPIDLEESSCKSNCICPPGTQRKCTVRREIPGSNAFVPAAAGILLGGEVIKDLLGK